LAIGLLSTWYLDFWWDSWHGVFWRREGCIIQQIRSSQTFTFFIFFFIFLKIFGRYSNWFWWHLALILKKMKYDEPFFSPRTFKSSSLSFIDQSRNALSQWPLLHHLSAHHSKYSFPTNKNENTMVPYPNKEKTPDVYKAMTVL
jgi:hypothetical protein